MASGRHLVAERVPTSLLGALADLVQWLESTQISAMVVGGVASSFLGRPRLTQDVDALAILPEDKWDAATEAARKFGIVPRIDQAVDFARRSRVLLLKHSQSDIDRSELTNNLSLGHTEVFPAPTRGCRLRDAYARPQAQITL
jgi:hypothetical protein